jgi:hypothetical protein
MPATPSDLERLKSLDGDQRLDKRLRLPESVPTIQAAVDFPKPVSVASDDKTLIIKTPEQTCSY